MKPLAPTMATYAPLDIPEDGKLAHNTAHPAPALPQAGLPIGPRRPLGAAAAPARPGR